MRLPTRNSLSPDQERIYTEAPLDGCTVIVGPPGTGKSVLGVFRAQLLRKKQEQFNMVMFNRVLRQFTLQSVDDAILKASAKTWHSWVYKWWMDANRGQYRQLPEVERMTPDFIKAMGLLDKVAFPSKLGWSNLIIDEGQDFPQEFYLMLNCVISNPQFHGTKAPALTVLADENQRLDPIRNSTISQIINALGIPAAAIYQLRKNFRNTREIAELSRVFHAGAAAELPELPTKSGPKPVLVKFRNIQEEADQIFRYAKLNEDLEIGVFLADQATQNAMHRELEHRCTKAGVTLQYYTYKEKDNLPVFDNKGSITLLCGKSVKGVEFDSVFIPQLTRYRTDGLNEAFLRMNFYVLSTRARRMLQFSYTDSTLPPDILKLFDQAGPSILERK